MLQTYDERNDEIFIYINGDLLPKNAAKISVFDSSVQGGDAVWEGLRLYEEGVFCLDKHVNRLLESAHALAFDDVPEKEYIKKAIFETIEKNQMNNDVHIRLTLTRGEKITSGMDPRLNQKGVCLIVIAEWKPPVYDNTKGIQVITSSITRNSPKFLDSKIHHNNLLNNILAKIQANVAGVDDAIMLDEQGFVAELNATNIFMLKDGKLLTPLPKACLPGITRSLVIEIANSLGISNSEMDLSINEFYNADLVFCTGTMGELTPIIEIDGRKISQNSSTLDEIQVHFVSLRKELCERM